MFPWQSGSEGTEETQRVHLNPLSGRWEPDLSRNQRHVNAAIFYNVWHYFQATGDLPFLRDYGAEMMLEIARFWGSIAHFNPERGRYEIHGVMGPDEFHEKYPGAAGGRASQQRLHQRDGGVAVRPGRRGALAAARQPSGRAAHEARDLRRGAAALAGHEPAHVRPLPRRRDHQPVRGLRASSRSSIGTRYRERYGNIQRLDRILRAEGDDPNRYKVSKQADVVMLFYLFSPSALRGLFERLGYEYPRRHGRAQHRLLRPAHVARLDAQLRHVRRSPRRRSTPRAPGSASWWRCAATPRTSRAARPARGFTWGSWRGRLI